MKNRFASIAMICLVGLLGSHAQAITVTDANSDFSVTYDPDEAGLFGTLFLSHNTIFFLPDSFIAESNNGTVGPVVSETLNLLLTATTIGFSFDSFFLQETGDYVLDGPNAEVSASGEMRVRAADAPNLEYTDGFDFIDSGDLGIGTNNWFGTASIDESIGWSGTEEQVYLTLQNLLTASTAELGERAFIQKKSTGIEIKINPVPVPGAVWLLASGLLGLAHFGRRR